MREDRSSQREYQLQSYRYQSGKRAEKLLPHASASPESEVMLPSNSLPLLRSLRPPPTGISSASSSLDSCLDAFPPLPPQSTKLVASHQLSAAQSQQQLSAMSRSISHTKSPLLSALMEMSEGSTVTESAIASSDDEVFSSPLLSVTKVRRFSEKKKPSNKNQDLYNTPSLSYIRALGHWQEQSFPPVPAVPAQFQEQALQGSGWTKCATREVNTEEGHGNHLDSHRVKDMTIDYNRLSITNSSSTTNMTLNSPSVMTMISPSELSLDTCDTSVNTCTSTIRSVKKHYQQDSTGLCKMSSMAQLSDTSGRRRRRSPFAFNIGTSDSLASLTSCTPSQPDTPTRRIAFSPSVRVDDSTPTEANWTRRNSTKVDGSRSCSKSYNGLSSGGVVIERPPPPPPRKDSRKGAKKKAAVFDSSRPSTAPDPNRRATEVSTFRKLLRPISRHTREKAFAQVSPTPPTFGSDNKMAESEAKEKERRGKIDQGYFVNASLHFKDHSVLSHHCSSTETYKDIHLERLPISPRPFESSYTSTVINEPKRNVYIDTGKHIMERKHIEEAFLHDLQFNSEVDGACHSYVDMDSHDARPMTRQMRDQRPSETLPLTINKSGGGMNKFKRVMRKMTGNAANRGPPIGLDELYNSDEQQNNQYRQFPEERYRNVVERRVKEPTNSEKVRFARSKMGFRPSTAPSIPIAPKWNTSSFNNYNKTTKVELQNDPILQYPGLAPTNQEWHNSDPFGTTRLAQWRRNPQYPPAPIRRHPWDTTPTTDTHEKSTTFPLHQSSLYHGNRDCSPPAINSQMQSRTIPLPVLRVSPDQLKRMQPVKIVKCPSFDALHV